MLCKGKTKYFTLLTKKNTPREPTIKINFRRSRDFGLSSSGLEERDFATGNKLVIEPLTKTLDIRDIINH